MSLGPAGSRVLHQAPVFSETSTGGRARRTRRLHEAPSATCYYSWLESRRAVHVHVWWPPISIRFWLWMSLSAAERAQFGRDGFLVRRGFYSCRLSSFCASESVWRRRCKIHNVGQFLPRRCISDARLFPPRRCNVRLFPPGRHRDASSREEAPLP